MKNPFQLPCLIAFFLGVSPLLSQETPASEDTKASAQLAKWLERFPEADTNEDGKLTREEADAFREKMKSQQRDGKRSVRAGFPQPTHPNIRYGDHERNVFDLWLPAGADDQTPLHVFFHGGGFVGGDKAGFDPRPFLEAGFAAASGNYRLVDGSETLSPIPMQDAARVIQTIRHRAIEWNLDTDRISVSGSSAGAVIAMWIGFHDDLADAKSEDPVARQSSRVHCIAPINGPTNLDPLWIRRHMGGPYHVHGSLPKMFGVAEGFDAPEVRKRINASNPWFHASADDPPTLMVYVGKLAPVPLAEDVSTGYLIHHPQFGAFLKERLDELGVENEFHTATDPRRVPVIVDWLKQQFQTKPAAE